MKAAILIFYKTVFSVRSFRIASIVMLGVVAAWTIAFFFANLLNCYPVTPYIEPFYGNNCINGLPVWWSTGITDAIIDMAILIMPIPTILKLQLPLKQKIAIIGLFVLGAT